MLIKNLYDLIITYLIALILFFPITGIILNDYNINLSIATPFCLALITTLIKFLCLISVHIKSLTKKATDHITSSLNKFSSFYQDHLKTSALSEYYDILILSLVLFLPLLISKYWLTVLIMALIYVLLGLGLNIVVGFAGLLDLGYVGFYAVGAYTYALGAEYLNLSFWLALPLGAIFAGLLGTLLAFPVLRMHGDYLAIVTLGFGEIIRLVLINWMSFTHGPSGVVVPKFSIFGLQFGAKASKDHITWHEFLGIEYNSKLKYIVIYVVLLLVIYCVIKFSQKIRNMPLGRAWEALRENEIAARSLGIYHVTTKLYAFSISAAIGGMGGVFFAVFQGFVNPTSFTFIESALILAIVVLGGMGSIAGVILAALFLTIIPEIFRDFVQFRMLLFGLVMVLMMRWRPKGFVQIKRPVFKI